jgi:GGDEF domain-containing protein
LEHPVPRAASPAWLRSLAGSPEPAALAEAAEALRGVAWELLLEELPGAGSQASAARLVGDVSDRLAESCAGLLIAAVATVAEEAPHVSGGEREDGPPGGGGPPAPSRSPAHAGRAPARGVGEPAIVIVDERRAAYASIERPPFRERVASAEIPGGAEIAIRDERGDEGPAAWVGSIGRQLERYERHGEPFAVLLLEARSDHAAGTELGYERLEDALEAELEGTGGSLTRERAGRYWALAPRTDRIGAEALAARLVLLTGAVAKRSGASITVLTGTAICPEDGTQAAALAAHADIGLYASRSDLSGRTRARGGHPADEPA